MRAARSTARPSTRGRVSSPSAPNRSLTSPRCMPVRTPGKSGEFECVSCRRSANVSAALGVSNVRKHPSPAQSIIRPPDSAATRRTIARCRSISSPTTWSPRAIFNAVESARSVKISVRIRELAIVLVIPGASRRAAFVVPQYSACNRALLGSVNYGPIALDKWPQHIYEARQYPRIPAAGRQSEVDAPPLGRGWRPTLCRRHRKRGLKLLAAAVSRVGAACAARGRSQSLRTRLSLSGVEKAVDAVFRCPREAALLVLVDDRTLYLVEPVVRAGRRWEYALGGLV